MCATVRKTEKSMLHLQLCNISFDERKKNLIHKHQLINVGSIKSSQCVNIFQFDNFKF